ISPTLSTLRELETDLGQSIEGMSKNLPATFRWLRTGEEALAAMLTAIERANQSIRLETYIYTPGQLGEKFRQALIQARQRQVKVRVLIDALGSLTLPKRFWDPLMEAGGEFRW